MRLRVLSLAIGMIATLIFSANVVAQYSCGGCNQHCNVYQHNVGVYHQGIQHGNCYGQPVFAQPCQQWSGQSCCTNQQCCQNYQTFSHAQPSCNSCVNNGYYPQQHSMNCYGMVTNNYYSTPQCYNGVVIQHPQMNFAQPQQTLRVYAGQNQGGQYAGTLPGPLERCKQYCTNNCGSAASCMLWCECVYVAGMGSACGAQPCPIPPGGGLSGQTPITQQ